MSVRPMRTDNDEWNLRYDSVLGAVESGDEMAKTKLAWLKLSGLGMATIDKDGAVTLLEEREKEGDGDAMWILGVCNEFGIGTEQNVEKAELLYKESSEKGNRIGGLFASLGPCGRGSGVIHMFDGGVEYLKRILSIAPWKELSLRGNLFQFLGIDGAEKISESLITNTTLTSLDLSMNRIGDEGAIRICESLMLNDSLKELNLSNNSIGVHGASKISELIMINTTLVELNIGGDMLSGGNNIEDEGAIKICDSLMINTTLTKLNLSVNNIKLKGAKRINELLRTNTSLTSLDLGWNNIGSEGAIEISQSLMNNISLNSLSLKKNGIGDEGVLRLSESLMFNTSLTELLLDGNRVTEEMKDKFGIW